VQLVVVVIFFGVYPQPLIDLTKTSVEGVRTHVLRADDARWGKVRPVVAAQPATKVAQPKPEE
jgi:hypothetical protein